MILRTPARAAAAPERLHEDPARRVELYRGDCLHLLDALNGRNPDGTFDCIFADPAEIWTMLAPKKAEKAEGRHPTQKPLAVVERCLLASTNPGDHVFDPFLGSGATAVASLRHGRAFTGIELDKAHTQLAVARVKAESTEKRRQP